ncbi:MAG: DegV family protein [Asgard group archaeon]|nr:DegV family protein [Asgard group archaeon]
MSKKSKGKLVLIADSACDLPEDIIDEYGIVILPISIYFPEETRTQYVDITTEEFFRMIDEEDLSPTTGVPSPRVYKQTFDKALEKHDEGIMLNRSGSLSGIYNYGVIYAKQFAEGKITAIDSRTATLPFGLLVLKTARMVRDGLTKEEILKKLKRLIPKVRLYAFVGNLKYLKRSGRISTLKHILGNLMQFKPLITIKDGVIQSPSRVRGEAAVMEYLKNLGEKAVKSLPKDETIVILHSRNFEKAEELVKHLEKSTKKNIEILTWEIGPAIGVHVGPGALGLTWAGKSAEVLLK